MWKLLLLCMLGVSNALGPAQFTLSPSGQMKVKIPADGFSKVAIHYNVNQELPGVTGSRFGQDLVTANGGFFEWQSTTQAKEGDTIHYWLWGEKNGQGETQTDLTGVIVSDHTATQQPTPKPTSPQPIVTNKPVGTASPTQSGSGAVTAGLSSGVTGSQNGSSGGSSGGGSGFMVGGSSYHGPSKSNTVNCQSYPCLIFEDDFNTLDFSTWEHEITAGGGGNWEFQYYTNNRSNSYVKDGTLFIKPTLTSDHYGEKFLTSGSLALWGGSSADMCTSNMFWGCQRDGSADHPINPIQSARLRSTRGFTMKYGKVEVEAKIPTGDWIWPAIWMLPVWNAYGQWPASGEIDIMESRGNINYHDDKGVSQGHDSVGSTLHFGPGFPFDPYEKAHAEKHLTTGTFSDSFHKFAVEWDESMIRFTIDGEELLKTVPPQGGFWELGEFDKNQPGMTNPWRGASKMAPFDQEFYLIMNVAVGGIGFFPDTWSNTPSAKPWSDKSEFTARDFYRAKNQWYPTWNADNNDGEDAALKVNYVKVWKMKP
ncbi:beta-1,3-glucan-binding protein-like isoform X2 [Mytilus galloprovincialis]|uniref:beta-1,3-glucan-binding protein-like isoform X2 n=1 Tax=Mytilus galloprovincialis TaxID=29158 RepID=UPI003F7C2FDD